jgi:flagellar biosynthesis protein FlhF
MSIYAKVLGIPLEVVNSPKAVRSALNRHLDRDLIFIDTEGRNIRDTQYLENISCLYKTGMPVETHLLMSANSDSDFLMKASQHYGSLAIDCLGFTKIDETERLGCILNVARVFKRPVRYVTMGQRIPQDIEFVHPGRLSDLILGRDENKCVSDMQGRSQGV